MPTDIVLPTPTFTETTALTETPTETPTLVLSETPPLEISPTPSETPTIEITASETPTIEATAEVLTPEITDEAITLPPETPTATPSETPTEIPTETPTPIIAQGRAVYQNRQPDSAQIRVRIYSHAGILLNTTATDAAGAYEVAVPGSEFIWLVVDAPLHRAVQLEIAPGQALPPIKLAGGDLDGDGCIGTADLTLFTANFNQPDTPTTDITHDGISDAADFAILSGNLRADCNEVTPTITPTSELTSVEVTAEATSEVTPELAAMKKLDFYAPG